MWQHAGRELRTLREVAALSENCNDTVAQEELAMFADRLRASCFLDVECVVALLIRGLRAVIPREALHIFTWEELRAEVCGSGKMDVELLKRHTVFEFGDETFQSYFWDALRSFTNEQQGKFLRFVWARDRLPSSDFQGSRMRVCQMRCRGNVDGALPQASTCTFTLTLPRYSSYKVLRNQVLIAVENCSSYDLDGGGAGIGVQFEAPQEARKNFPRPLSVMDRLQLAQQRGSYF